MVPEYSVLTFVTETLSPLSSMLLQGTQGFLVLLKRWSNHGCEKLRARFGADRLLVIFPDILILEKPGWGRSFSN